MDVFFVISGYLITGIILQDIRGQRFTYLGFYARRFRRIVPALFVVLVTTWGFGWLFLLPDEFSNLGRHVMAASIFASNVELFTEVGYFDTLSDLKPLLHLWSLGIEEQYYIFWPLIIGLIVKFCFRTPVWILLLLLGSFGFMLGSSQAAAFYLLPARFWELLIGGGLAWIELERPNSLNRAFTLVLFEPKPSAVPINVSENLRGVAAIAMLAIAVVHLTKSTTYPSSWALLPTGAAFLIITAGPQAFVNRVLLGNALAIRIGLISYPLYLWHWPLLSFTRILVGEPPPIWIRGMLIAVATLLAWLTWRFVERPIQTRLLIPRPDVKREYALIGGAVGALAITTFVGGFSALHRGFPFRIDHLATSDLGQAGWEKYLGSMGLSSRFCDDNPLFRQVEQRCLSTKRQESVNYAIYGDSHAEHFTVGLLEASNMHDGWIIVTKSGCPPVRHLDVIDNSTGKDLKCDIANEISLELLVKHPDIKTVVLSFLSVPYFQDRGRSTLYARDGQFSISSKINHGSGRELFQAGLAETILALQNAGKTVILLVDNPELPFDLNACIRKANRDSNKMSKDCILTKAEFDRRTEETKKMFDSLKRDMIGLFLYDGTDLFCTKTECKFMHQGHSLYRDTDHLSVFGSRIASGKLLNWLKTTGL